MSAIVCSPTMTRRTVDVDDDEDVDDARSVFQV